MAEENYCEICNLKYSNYSGLWKHNKNNTYIDIGSTLNIWTEKNIRDYQSTNGVYTNKTCKF